MPAKTAIVTGASSGIGRECAIALSKAGWNVVLAARRLDALNETVALCTSPDACLVSVGDITDEVFVKQMFADAVAKFGRLDVLFNNAGVGSPAVPFEDLSLETFLNVLNINVVASFLCAREAVRVFKNQTPSGGRIINNGSISAHTPRPMSAPYTAAKHAITGLTKSINLDGREVGITCTQIDIGNAATAMTERMKEGVLQPDGRRVPEDTFAVEHVASSIVYIAGLPKDVCVPSYTIMAARAPFAGRG